MLLRSTFELLRQYFIAVVTCAAIEAKPPQTVYNQSCFCVRKSREEHVGGCELRADGSRLTKIISKCRGSSTVGMKENNRTAQQKCSLRREVRSDQKK